MKTRRNQIIAGLLLVSTLLGGMLWAGVTQTGQSNRRVQQAINRTQVNDSSGSVVLVAAKTGQRIQVWGITLATASNTTMEFLSSATTLTGPLNINAIQVDPPFGRVTDDYAVPWLEGLSGGEITLTLGSAVQVTGQVIWSQKSGEN